MESIGERLKRRWTSEGTGVRPGVSDADLAAFESRYGVRLPEDMREYFRVVNGTAECDMDNDLYAFWPLEEVRPISERFPENSHLPGSDPYFLFADHSIYLFCSAIRLGPDPTAPNPIMTFIGYSGSSELYSATRNETGKTINSFTEFVEELFEHGLVQ